MAVVLLPPGNKIKILSQYEILQLADVIRSSEHVEDSIKNLEKKWKKGANVYDIDLINVAAVPLSSWCNGERNSEIAETLQKSRRRKRCTSNSGSNEKQAAKKLKMEEEDKGMEAANSCEKKVAVTMVSIPEVEEELEAGEVTDEETANRHCAQDEREWDKLWKKRKGKTMEEAIEMWQQELY